MTYANALAIPLVGIIGDRELEEGTVTLKNMVSGEQQQVKVSDFANVVKNILEA